MDVVNLLKEEVRMIDLPKLEKAFEYENNFYLLCDSKRMAKIIAQYKLFEKTLQIEGDIIECGVFKGASFSRFAMFRQVHDLEEKKLIGFDTFGDFPETEYEKDKELREKFIEGAGNKSISCQQLMDVLLNKQCDSNVSLIQGNIVKTVPEFVNSHQNLKISLLNIDVDIYEPTVTILEYLYPLVSKNGIIILDDYGTFPGETNAVDEYFLGKNVSIEPRLFDGAPHYIVKNE